MISSSVFLECAEGLAPKEKDNVRFHEAVRNCARDRSRMAKTAQRAWFTRARSGVSRTRIRKLQSIPRLMKEQTFSATRKEVVHSRPTR